MGVADVALMGGAAAAVQQHEAGAAWSGRQRLCLADALGAGSAGALHHTHTQSWPLQQPRPLLPESLCCAAPRAHGLPGVLRSAGGSGTGMDVHG